MFSLKMSQNTRIMQSDNCLGLIALSGTGEILEFILHSYAFSRILNPSIERWLSTLLFPASQMDIMNTGLKYPIIN